MIPPLISFTGVEVENNLLISLLLLLFSTVIKEAFTAPLNIHPAVLGTATFFYFIKY